MLRLLLLLSLIQASLFSHALAMRVAIADMVTKDTVQVQGGANGWLLVMCDHATGLKNTDLGGKADPFCQIELQDRGGSMVSRSIGLYREDTVNGSKSKHIRLNEHVAFDLQSPKSLDQFKVKVSVRDDDR